MRYLAIGDIHGCSLALERLIEVVQPQPEPEDIIITLGDYINKGPDSQGVIDKLIQLSQTQNLICLKGNHEQELLQIKRNKPALKDIALSEDVPQGDTASHISFRAHNGMASLRNFDHGIQVKYLGIETLSSYSLPGKKLSLVNIPETHWEFIEHTCLDSWENEDYIFVHANLDPQLPLAQQSDWHLFWQKLTQPIPHCSGKTMICGHTSQKNGQPLNFGHAICIDTWACGRGWLTCLDVYGGKIWQTNQQGQVKQSQIEHFLPSSSLVTA
jgi:serine/threonine protein phosphatase 1